MSDFVKDLYPYALAEGEGVGTAYEYRAKAAVTGEVVRRLGAGARLLVAGLPQKYGTSTDFAIHAERAKAEVSVVDERPAAIERARRAVEALRKDGRLETLRVTYRVVTSLETLEGVEPHDAVLSCEVLQRIPSPSRAAFAERLRQLGPIGAVFVPNADNASHLTISGLGGSTLSEMRALFHGAAFGYVDMPPFPPGIKRSEDQRAAATSGTAEAIAMRLLDVYCSAEPLVPAFIKRRFAHLVCARWGA
jgi:hypothetical protein